MRRQQGKWAAGGVIATGDCPQGIQDAWLRFGDRGFFVNVCCTIKDESGAECVRIEMYEMKPDFQTWVRDVCSITKPTVREVMEEFTRIPLIDGKTFWELENELEWV